MNFLKTSCVVIVLSAVAYGAFVTLTAPEPGAPPPEAAGWNTEMNVQLPGAIDSPTGSFPDLPAAPAASGGDGHRHVGGAAPSFVPESPAQAPAATTARHGDVAPAGANPAAYDHAHDSPPFVAPSVGPPSNDQIPAAYPRTAYPDDRIGLSPEGVSIHMPDDAANPTGGTISTATPDPGIAPVGGISPGDDPSPSRGVFPGAMNNVQVLLNQGKLAEAHLELSKWFGNSQLSAAEHQQLLDLLDQVAGTVVYSRQHLLEAAYTVQPGDTLENVAERYQVPWQLLAKINGVADPQRLRPGDQLKMIRGPFDAVIDLDQFQLTLFLQSRYAGRFRIGVGQDYSTPTGQFVVKNKVTNPTYYGPTEVVAADDPNNPLGERWIDLGSRIGIHGTIDLESIGRAESRGCIRLSPTDIEDVFDILSVGSRVTIHR